jgi:DNA-binding HxlR family transcriptional regulator
MPLRTSWAKDACPIARGADVFGDPWAVLVLREVFIGNNRFDGIRTQLGIAESVLSNRLRRLVEAGILCLEPYISGGRPRNKYCLTSAGVDALSVLHAIAGWAQRNTAAPEGKLMRVICSLCGTDSAPGFLCASCGEQFELSTTSWDHPNAPGRVISLGKAETIENAEASRFSAAP